MVFLREMVTQWVVHGVPQREGNSIWFVHGMPQREGYYNINFKPLGLQPGCTAHVSPGQQLTKPKSFRSCLHKQTRAQREANPVNIITLFAITYRCIEPRSRLAMIGRVAWIGSSSRSTATHSRPCFCQAAFDVRSGIKSWSFDTAIRIGTL